MMKKLLLTLLTVFSVSAFSKELSKDELQTIDSQLSVVVENARTGKIGELMLLMPPSVFKVLAQKAGVSEEKLKSVVVESVNARTKGVTFEGYSYELTNIDVKESSSNREYMFLPTKATMSKNNKKHTSDGYLLGIKENNEWYFMRCCDAQSAQIFELVYPDLANLKTPE